MGRFVPRKKSVRGRERLLGVRASSSLLPGGAEAGRKGHPESETQSRPRNSGLSRRARWAEVSGLSWKVHWKRPLHKVKSSY